MDRARGRGAHTRLFAWFERGENLSRTRGFYLPQVGAGRIHLGVIPIGTEKKRINWVKIRAEYAAGGTTLQKLADKYGLSFSTVQQRSQREGWRKDREAAKIKVVENVVAKAAEKAADNATLAADIKRKGLMLINRLFDAYAAEATEHRDYQGRNLTDIKRLRDLTGAYKDLTGDILPGASANNELLQSLLDMEKRDKP